MARSANGRTMPRKPKAPAYWTERTAEEDALRDCWADKGLLRKMEPETQGIVRQQRQRRRLAAFLERVGDLWRCDTSSEPRRSSWLHAG
jgi:hypothetical protein